MSEQEPPDESIDQPDTISLKQNWLDMGAKQPIPYASAFAIQANPSVHEFTLSIGIADLPLLDTYSATFEKLKEEGEIDVIPIVHIMVNPIRLTELHSLIGDALKQYMKLQQDEGVS